MAKSAREMREKKAALRALLANGATEYECMDELGLTSLASLRKLRQSVLSDELEEVHDEGVAALYARYKMRMDGCISDLDAAIKKGQEKHTSLNAVVGAVRAKAAIIDNVIKRGQDLGVLPIVAAKPEEAGKDTEGLRAKVDEMHEDLRGLVKRYGDANYEDEDDEELYVFGLETEPETEPEPEPVRKRKRRHVRTQLRKEKPN